MLAVVLGAVLLTIVVFLLAIAEAYLLTIEGLLAYSGNMHV